MAPVITLVVPSRLQHRARRSLSRPTAERPRKTPAPVVCILTALAGRLQHQRVREQGGGHRRQARLWENISSHLASHAQPRGRVGRTRHASCSQSLLDSQFGLRCGPSPAARSPARAPACARCGQARAASSQGQPQATGPTASLGRWQSLLGRAGPGRLALSPHGGAPLPRGRGRYYYYRGDIGEIWARHCRGVEGGALEQRPGQHHREVRARHPHSARLQRLAAFPRVPPARLVGVRFGLGFCLLQQCASLSANHSSGVPCGQTCSDPGSNSEAPRTLGQG